MVNKIAAALMFCVLVPFGIAQAQTRVVPNTASEVTLSYAPLVKDVAPAVVNIFTQKTVTTQRFRSPLFDDPFFRRFFGDSFGGAGGGPRERIENSLGSGVILSEDGLVMTNHHVIADADDIQVILRDRRAYKAELLLSDERTDLAVLRLLDVRDPLPLVKIGNSDAVEVGDLVLAIGNPFGVGQTVTSGIVSGLARTSVDISDYQSFIQTDAAINPGNSGGALVAMDGTLIGVNTAIFSGSGGSHGIGFAVPSNMVAAVLRSAETGEALVRPWLGFQGRAVDWDIAEALGMETPTGVIVENVVDGGPAHAAGLRSGDIIRSIDGIVVEDPLNLRFQTATKPIGTALELGILRNAEPLTLTFGLIAPPEDPPRDSLEITSNVPFAGATFVNLSPALRDELGLKHYREGVMAVRVNRRSSASRVGLRVGDILRSINGRQIALTEDLRRVLRNPPSVWQVVVDRNGERIAVELR